MIIKRQKTYSFGGDILRWAKNFTPRIPLGKNSRLWILWPGTIVGGLFGVLVGIKNIVKHIVSGKESHDHDTRNRHTGEIEEKSFSSLPKKATVFDYCEAIPEYEKLMALETINRNLLNGVPEDIQEFIWRYYPSFLSLARPEEMNEYRRDYMSSGDGDYTEVLFAFGNELVYLYDFDREAWYVQDYTYSPKKEWKIGSDVLKAIRINFDPKENKLLEKRIKVWEENDKLEKEMREFIRKYCNSLLSAIDATINKN